MFGLSWLRGLFEVQLLGWVVFVVVMRSFVVQVLGVGGFMK
jgi:hypothetical protein